MKNRHFMDIGGILRDLLAAGKCTEADHVWENNDGLWCVAATASDTPDGYEWDKGTVADVIADAERRGLFP